MRCARLNLRWLAAGSTLALLTLAGTQAEPPVIPEDVRSTARLRVDYGYCPGIVVGLMTTNGPAYFCYGAVDLDGGPAVDEHTLFEIGSIGKVFTTTLLVDMAQRKELGLNDAIQVYLPEGITAPTWFDQPITLTHLATHTSGLPATWTNLNPTDGNNPFAGYTTTLMYEFLDSYALTRAPGATYEYSNFAMGLLGQLLVRKAGLGYQELVVTRIADELGLPDTRIDLTPDQQARLAQCYSGVVPIPPLQMGDLEGAGALRSTAQDMLSFLAANRGWRPSPLQEAMVEAQRSRYPTGTPGLDIGLGWHLYTANSSTHVWHSGATFGQRAFAGFKRNGRVLAVVLANSDFDVTDIGFHLLDATAPLTTVRRPVALTESTLRRYVGRYEGEEADSFAIGLLRSHLTAEYEYRPGLLRTFTLHSSGANRFYLTFPEANATFLTNSAGQATALVWTQAGTTSTYAKVRLPARLALRCQNGMPQLSLTGETDRSYVIQASADLKRWSSLSTNTIWDGPIVDRESAALHQRFYRVIEP